MRNEVKTEPIDHVATHPNTPRLVISPYFKDEATGALYVHQDLVRAQEPYAEEAHVPPMAVEERFGDVESFVAYVQRYGTPATLLTWNSQGLRAVLDYAQSSSEPGRRKWRAVHPFQTSPQWQAWMALANGSAIGQRAAVEKIEDLAEDIVEPAPTDLANLLRSLRASVNAKADSELRPDGTYSVSFAKDSSVKSAVGGNVDLPAFFVVSIPVLRGHVDSEGRPVLYRLPVRLRVSTDGDAHLTLRLSIPSAARVLEDAFADRVRAASELLGEEYRLLRAAD